MPTAPALEALPGSIQRPKAAPARCLHDKDVARLHQRFIAAGEFFNAPVYARSTVSRPRSPA